MDGELSRTLVIRGRTLSDRMLDLRVCLYILVHLIFILIHQITDYDRTKRYSLLTLLSTALPTPVFPLWPDVVLRPPA